MSPSEKISSREAITFGQFSLFPAARSLEHDGRPVALGSRAIEILSLLLERAGTVVDKKELIARAWPHVTVVESGLKVQVASLRKVLRDGQDGNRYIATVSGRGYSFVAPVERSGKALHAKSEIAGLRSPDEAQPFPSTKESRDEIIRHLSTYVSKYRLIAIREATPGTMGAVAAMDEVVAALESAMRFVSQSQLDKTIA